MVRIRGGAINFVKKMFNFMKDYNSIQIFSYEKYFLPLIMFKFNNLSINNFYYLN